MRAKSINQSMELCKFIASIFVVFIHFGFQGGFGTIINCIARFAVPVFFAISGYFSYKTDSARISKRISHIFKLNIIATIVYIGWNIYYCVAFADKDVFRMFGEKITALNITKWLIMGINPFAGHLWYLSAILLCYIILWIYVRFFDDNADYRPFYAASLGLFVFFIVFSAFTANEKIQYQYTVYRNGLFFGIPMFGLGMFLREYEDRIIKTLNFTTTKEILCIFIGLVISLIQYKGFGKSEMPVGITLTVIALILLMSQNPHIPFLKENNTFFVYLGKISLTIYIIHILIGNFLKTQTVFYENYSKHILYPFLIAGLSIGCGIVFNLLTTLYKKATKKKHSSF